MSFYDEPKTIDRNLAFLGVRDNARGEKVTVIVEGLHCRVTSVLKVVVSFHFANNMAVTMLIIIMLTKRKIDLMFLR